MSLYILFGIIFCASFILTMVGLGGGLIFSPLFLLIGFPKMTAVSASLFLNGVAAVSAAIVYYRQKMVDFSLSIPLVITSSIGAPLGALMTSFIDIKLFLILMALIVFLGAARMILPGRIKPAESSGRRARIIGGGLIGLVIGFMGGLLGIGGGVFIVPLLIFFLGVPTKTAAASSIFIVCFSSFAGFATYASLGTIDWRFVLPAAIFSFAGGQAGSRIMVKKISGRTIRILFGVILLAFCAKLLQKALL
ncbi:MAG: sulfite exporter TauE/SafE family protein [Thermodesulfobacteriota bacterium]|nr:sulfite exporter TauE/SafE family protein [Thermodesulfobacteriota bacterium]